MIDLDETQVKELRERVVNSINAIVDEKIKSRREPRHALLSEVYAAVDSVPRSILNKYLRHMLDTGVISAGRTINDTWIRIKNER